MTVDAIDHRTLVELSSAGALRGAHVVGEGHGWGLMVDVGATSRRLEATRSREPRIFKSMEKLVVYLQEVGIKVFDVDARNFDAEAVGSYKRPDAAEALKETHAAAAYDRWFREQVEAGLKEAADPSALRISNEDVKAAAEERRAALRSGVAVTTKARRRP